MLGDEGLEHSALSSAANVLLATVPAGAVLPASLWSGQCCPCALAAALWVTSVALTSALGSALGDGCNASLELGSKFRQLSLEVGCVSNVVHRIALARSEEFAFDLVVVAG